MAVAVGLLAGVSGAWAEKVDVIGETTKLDINQANVALYDADATSWTTTMANPKNGKFSDNYVVITKYDLSEKLAGLSLTSATLKFHSACTVSTKNSQLKVALIGTNWNSESATWDSTNTTEILDVQEFYTSDEWVKESGADLQVDVTKYVKDDDDKVIGFAIYTGTAREQKLSSIKLSLEYVDPSTSANYTVKFVDTNGKELKSSELRMGGKGSSISISTEDKQSIYTEDNTKKYIYVSDDAGDKTVAEDGSSVVNVTFREAETWNYTVNGVDTNGNILKELATGSDFEGESVKVPYLAYVNVGGTLYGSSASNKEYNYTFVLDEVDAVKTITYKMSDQTDIVYFSEAEDIEGMTVTTEGQGSSRCSGAKGAYNSSETAVKVVTLTAGKYKLTARVFGNSGTNILVNYGEDNNWKIATNGSASSFSETITLRSSVDLTLPKAGSSQKGLDYIYIQRLADTKTIPATGYATFSSSSNVTVPAGVKVYKARISDDAGSIVLTEVGGEVIPANTGVVLVAKGGQDVTLSVSADVGTADFSGNALIATSVAEYATVPSSGTYYALSTSKAEFGVLEAGLTLSSNKAYLAAPASEAKTLSISFEGTNGIGEAPAATVANGAYYTLQGLKVEKPAKGLYIHNGKKVLINK